MSGRDTSTVAPPCPRAPGGVQEHAAGRGPAAGGGSRGRSAPFALEETQRKTLADCVGCLYPAWTIWSAHGTWYATRPPRAGALARTLHAPSAGALCERLATAEPLTAKEESA
ncbi:hypothetical protein GCM10010466_40250 [Planomonospora alba]|uniref:Uncharacterized protein n=1 Tax=Planomonospora alba TaxID=161354 RepID=A0ABP6NE09_9ACTN